jgi:hypothetical protein
MPKEIITYSEAFKKQVVDEIRQGKFASMRQARIAYSINGSSTIKR